MLSRLAQIRMLSSRRLVSGLTPKRQVHDIAEYFRYTRAIVCDVNQRLVKDALRFDEPVEPISFEKAKRDHANYVQQVRNLLPGKIVQIPTDETFPDQVFVEDPAVVYDGTALLTNMRAPSRAGEKVRMRRALEELGLPISEMTREGAHLDGGDVLFTGREFLIGLSSRTNAVGLILSIHLV